MDQKAVKEKYRKQVIEYMEKNGDIGKLKAEIKTKILKAMEKQPKQAKHCLEFDYLTPFQKHLKSREILITFHLIKEFMEFFELAYTIPVFESETNVREKIQKDNLIREIGITNFDDKQPILLNLLNAFSFYKENYTTLVNQNPNFSKTNSLLNQDKFSSLKNINSNSKPQEEIAEMINEIREKVKNQEDPTVFKPESSIEKDSNPLASTTGKIKGKLPPISFSNDNSVPESNSPMEKKNEKLNYLKKFEEKEKSPTNKNFVPNITFNSLSPSNQSNENIHIVHNPLTVSHNLQEPPKSPHLYDPLSENIEQTVKSQTNFTNSKPSNPNNKSLENIHDIKEDIIEEIDVDYVEDFQEDKGDKKSVSGSGVFASSQTFGYDNSVTSYNLDFYDYIEDVEKI